MKGFRECVVNVSLSLSLSLSLFCVCPIMPLIVELGVRKLSFIGMECT